MTKKDEVLAYYRQIITEIRIGERAYRPTLEDIGAKFGFTREMARLDFKFLDEDEKKIWRNTPIHFCFNESGGKLLAEIVTENLEQFFEGQHGSILTQKRLAKLYEIVPARESEIRQTLEKYMAPKNFRMWLFLNAIRKPKILHLIWRLYQIGCEEVANHREAKTLLTNDSNLAQQFHVFQSYITRLFKVLAFWSDVIAERQKIIEEQNPNGIGRNKPVKLTL